MLTPTCPVCGKPIRPGARFCSRCRAPLNAPVQAQIACSRCGTSNRASARFCARCAQPLTAMPVSPASSPRFWLVGVGVAASVLVVVLVIILVIALNKSGTAIAANQATGTPIPSATSTAANLMTATASAKTNTPIPPTRIVPAVGLKVGNTAPDFALVDSAGKTLRLSGLRGKPVIINFWASWCGFCRQEMPDLNGLYQDSQAQSLIVLGINTEDQDRAAAEKMVRDYALTFPILWDQDNHVSQQYQLRGYPGSFFIDRDGVIRAVVNGSMNRATMNEQVKLIF